MLINPDFECVKSNILIAHGELDKVVPLDLAKEAFERLKQKGINVKMVTSPKLEHATDGYLINEAVDFLKSL